MVAWNSLTTRWKIFLILAGAVVIVSVAYALNIRFVLLGDKGVTAVDDFGEAIAAAVAAAACGLAATRAQGKDRLGWALMGTSAGLWSAGEVVWSIYEVILGVPTPYPSLADAGFLAAVPFAIAGIRAFWSDAALGTSARWRVWFDGTIVAMALTSTAWGFGLRTVWESPSTTKLLDLAYPVGDILTGTVLILAIRRATGQQKGRMALLLVGIASYSVADSAFSYLTAQGAFGSVGNVIDTGWFAGYLLIALAALYPSAAPKAATSQARLDLWQLALPWMTLLTASAADLFSALTGHENLFQTSLTGALALLLTVNMILERREFLDMLTEIEASHHVLSHEFKSALVKIRHFSVVIRDVERLDIDEVRQLAADIHRDAERLDDMLEAMVSPEEQVRRNAGVAVGVAVASGEVVAAGQTS
ncbi:MAG TPA: hypothetical protein VJT78_14630 [Candidatus Dormibacteraeota bacterium]|nr:hypothetical protein [Candidatus Dormibacteraeota bacterium]